jgi:hypothetical protein
MSQTDRFCTGIAQKYHGKGPEGRSKKDFSNPLIIL